MNRMFCTHPEKVVFDNERSAKHAARMAKKKAYKCLCGGWHLTSDQTRTKSRYRFSKEKSD